MSFLAIVQAAGGVLSSVAGIFSNDADKARYERVQEQKALALGGSRTALVLLECWSGNRAVEPEVKALGLWAPTDTACGMGGKGREYAGAALLEVRARLAGSQALAAAGAGALQASGQLSPTGPAAFLRQLFGRAPPWVVAVGVVALVWVGVRLVKGR